MQAIRKALYGPTPEEQKSECLRLIRKNNRELNRPMNDLKKQENEARANIIAASKRAQRQPAHAKEDLRHVRELAKRLVKIRKQNNRLATSRAQLQSMEMQVKEAFSVRKIQGSMKASTGIMKDVNTLVRLPEITGTMRELSQELVKAGIIDEMVSDMLPSSETEEDEAADAEVDKILGEVLKDRLPPSLQTPQQDIPIQAETEEDRQKEKEEEAKELDAMSNRLAALYHS